jgi:3-oxoacyl-[acyl-carrier-protein] synthase-1
MFITASGMTCPVGLGAEAACAAKQAGISAIADLPYYDNSGNPVVGGAVPDMDWGLQGSQRLIELLVKCLADVLQTRPGTRWDRVPLIVGLAEPGRPGGGAGLAESIVEAVGERLDVRFQTRSSRVFASGHTAGFDGLRAARRVVREGTVSACLVCGVDSFLDPATLLWLDRHYRLKTPANRDGVIPGEAAAAVLLELKAGTGAASEVAGLGFGMEPAPILSQEPLLGRGLADAARAALAEANVGWHEVDVRLSDVTGELYGFKELALAEARLARVVRREEQPLWHWADAIGDSGSAAGLAQLVLADYAFRKGDTIQCALCLASSIPGQRAAVVLRRCQGYDVSAMQSATEHRHGL